ncbi:SPOR domain-containing protein [Hanstruepera ponticola]|uniref:SPOR domain-containing protein n=1 Tax=Hanstruepera ponticola TaxID=2042995 RepID=UPI000CF0EED8|nr:SPOR domain-containing protein [Hanstruepera ponticola]
MKLLTDIFKITLVFSLALLTTNSFAQQGGVTINQDQDLVKLLALKKDMNLYDNDSDRYKIQIYSGNRQDAEKAKSKIRLKMPELLATLEFETPNYKVWVGNYRSRLEADRSLVKVQKEFQNAFVFKPKKERD